MGHAVAKVIDMLVESERTCLCDRRGSVGVEELNTFARGGTCWLDG